MAKTPDFVVTGVHIPKVHFWARVLVRPERLQNMRSDVDQTIAELDKWKTLGVPKEASPDYEAD